MIIMKLYGPALLSIVLIILSFRIKFGDETIFKAKVPFVEFDIPIKSRILCRLILVCLSLSCIYYYFTMDFSSFFPQRYLMDVYWDEDGLRESLSKFSSKELEQIGFIDNNKESAKIYYDALDKTLKKMLNYEGFFSTKEGIIHSHGESYFKVEKTSGFHKYHIIEAEGELIHKLDRRNARSISFKTIFEKIPSSHDYFRPTFSDIIIKRGAILQPRFKQILMENYRSDGIVFDHTLVGVTKVNFFPVPSFGNSIYLFELPNGNLVPIAYAVYKY